MDQADSEPILDLTVFILSYNRPHYLREMLLSVLSQTAVPEEIVILDNGSDKGTKEAVQDLIGGRVSWVGADHNNGSLWNFKRAFNLSGRKYFTILHDDDRLLPSFLEKMVGVLESESRMVAITCNGYIMNEKGGRTGFKMLPGTNDTIVHLRSGEEAARQYSYKFIPFPNVVYRNGFPQKVAIKEEFGKVWDSVFIIDLAKLGWIGMLDDLLFEYRYHSGQDSSELPEDLVEMKEEYILNLTSGSIYGKDVLRNVRRRQSRRLSGLLLVSIFFKKDPRYFFERSKRFGYRRANELCVLYYLLFNRLVHYREYVRLRVLDDVRAP